MKTLLLLTLLVSTQIFASEAKPLKACGEYAAIDLTEDHAEWTETFYMLNAKKEVVGAFSYRDGEIHAAVCDYVEAENVTVANIWYEWEKKELSANPADWKKETSYWLAQDKGLAFFQVVKTSESGEVMVKFSVMGMDEEGDDVEMRSDVLTLKKVY